MVSFGIYSHRSAKLSYDWNILECGVEHQSMTFIKSAWYTVGLDPEYRVWSQYIVRMYIQYANAQFKTTENGINWHTLQEILNLPWNTLPV